MPISISFPPYSFIQSAPPLTGDCYPDPAQCLPLSSNQHLRFYASIKGIDYDMITTYLGEDPEISLLPYLAVVPPDYDCTPATYINQSTSETVLLGPGMVPLVTFIKAQYFALLSDGADTYCNAYFNAGDNIDLATLSANDNIGQASAHTNFAPAVGECFKLAIVLDVVHDDQYYGTKVFFRQVAGCIGCFVRTAGDCYTSVITYSDPTDSFGFTYQLHDYYGDDIHLENRIELPCYLRDPVMNDDTKVYTRSDGTIIKLYERKEEQYMLETDRMPYTWLKALDIALSHDSVKIDNGNTRSYDSVNTAKYFQKKENFEIEYQKGPFSAFGKGNCKLLNAQPVHLYNNNC
ncbi:MAG: hypothetical protein JST90_15685 [Bacteroidetes bacterium]|nr:hypothetical protein [Bacteroidota bacterium]